jgi:hypothetical protein
VPQPPTRPATTTHPRTKQLASKLRAAAAETNPDRHATASHPPEIRTGPLTPLPDCCATQTGASLRPGPQSLRPSPASSISSQRQSHKTSDLHAPKALNRRCRQRPLPAKESQIASASSFRPKLQPAPQPGIRPSKRPTDQDNTSTLKPPELWLRRPTFQDAVHSANHLFARCVSIYQLKTLTEQGAHEHYLAFLRR